MQAGLLKETLEGFRLRGVEFGDGFGFSKHDSLNPEALNSIQHAKTHNVQGMGREPCG